MKTISKIHLLCFTVLFFYNANVFAEDVNPKFITNETGTPQQSPGRATDWTGLRVKEEKAKTNVTQENITVTEKSNVSASPIKSNKISKSTSIKNSKTGVGKKNN